MNIHLECGPPDASIPDAFDIYQTIVSKDYTPSSQCYFNRVGNRAIFDSGHPYEDGQRCLNTFSCNNASEIVHFKFNRFEMNRNNDYLAIDLPTEVQGRSGLELEYLETTFQVNLQNRLVLDGLQRTDVWVSAETIQDFNLYFYRKVHV